MENNQQNPPDGLADVLTSPTTATNEERPQRVRRRPAWMTDYEVAEIDQTEDTLTYFALFSDCDPTIFEEAVKESKWRTAMDEEIQPLNETTLGS